MKTSAPAVGIRAREGRILPSKVQPLSGAGETRGLGGVASDLPMLSLLIGASAIDLFSLFWFCVRD